MVTIETALADLRTLVRPFLLENELVHVSWGRGRLYVGKGPALKFKEGDHGDLPDWEVRHERDIDALADLKAFRAMWGLE